MDDYPIFVTPARAGMIPYGAKKIVIKNGKPRASGDDPMICMRITTAPW